MPKIFLLSLSLSLQNVGFWIEKDTLQWGAFKEWGGIVIIRFRYSFFIQVFEIQIFVEKTWK